MEEKARNLFQNLAKKWVYKFLPKCWPSVFFPEKNMFSLLKTGFDIEKTVKYFQWVI